MAAFFTASTSQGQTWEWARNTGSIVMGETDARHTVTNAAGETLLLGHFEGQVCFGSTQLQGRGYQDVFLAKYDDNGTVAWAYQIGGSNDDFTLGLALADSSGVVGNRL